MKNLYVGTRDGLCRVSFDGRPLKPRHDLINHSPDGFEWGYGGSGPAQLALAICAHHLNDDRIALAVYQEFKWRVVVSLPHEAWSLSAASVAAVIEAIIAEGAQA